MRSKPFKGPRSNSLADMEPDPLTPRKHAVFSAKQSAKSMQYDGQTACTGTPSATKVSRCDTAVQTVGELTGSDYSGLGLLCSLPFNNPPTLLQWGARQN
jgi:hypothetical protein